MQLIGIGTPMAIGGANPHVFFASNLPSFSSTRPFPAPVLVLLPSFPTFVDGKALSSHLLSYYLI
jgi:hypothetical protein